MLLREGFGGDGLFEVPERFGIVDELSGVLVIELVRGSFL